MRHTQLRAFHAVARAGGFSKAAERLRLTQPALTIQVRALEEAYGVSLFDRVGSRVTLTPLGRALFELTRKLDDIEDQARELLTTWRKLETGSLRVAAGGPYVVMAMIAEFTRRHPGVVLDVSFGNTDQVWRALLDRQVDLAVLTGAPADERVLALPVARQRVAVMLPPGHPLAARARVAPRDLEGQAVILREDDSYTRRLVDEMLARAGVRVRPVLRLGSREAVHEAVAEGLGIGFVLERETGADSRVKCIVLTNTKASGEDTLVCLKSQAKRRVVEAFFEVARSLRAAAA